MKEASPGSVDEVDLVPAQSTCASPAEMVICRLISSSSWSMVVVPSMTLPRRFLAPVVKSRASTSEVLPAPRWPTTAMFLILAGSTSAMDPPRVTVTTGSEKGRHRADSVTSDSGTSRRVSADSGGPLRTQVMERDDRAAVISSAPSRASTRIISKSR